MIAVEFSQANWIPDGDIEHYIFLGYTLIIDKAIGTYGTDYIAEVSVWAHEDGCLKKRHSAVRLYPDRIELRDSTPFDGEARISMGG